MYNANVFTINFLGDLYYSVTALVMLYQMKCSSRSCLNDAGNDPAAGCAKYRNKSREIVRHTISETKWRTNK